MKILLFIISTFLAAVEFVAAQGAVNYYPIQVGDTWVQHTDSINNEYDPTTFTMAMEGTDLIFGEIYNRKSNWMLADDDSSDSKWYVWLRSTPTGIVIVAMGGSSNIDSANTYNPPLPWLPNEIVNLGHTWEFDFPPTGHFSLSVESISENVTVPAGTYNNCIKIKIIITNEFGDTTQTNYYYLAENVGEVVNDGWSIWQGDFRFELINLVIVPVELSAFKAFVKGQSVHLNWQTETETNNYGFEIQRSFNSEWETVDFVPGNGSTSESHFYEYIDKHDPGISTVYYRLKQIDTDGSFEYSSVLNVTLNVPTNYQLSNNYPNPFNASTVIRYSLPIEGFVRINIYDELGRLIRTLLNKNQSPGDHTMTWDGKNDAGEFVSSGLYFYRMTAGTNTITKQMIMIK